MNDNNFNAVDYDEKAVEFLKSDFSILLKGIEGKKLDEINLDAVIELLEILKSEVERVKDGVRARDNFISYTIDPDNVSSIFDNKDTLKR